MNQELCDIKNMLFEMAASVRHLSEEIETLKSEINLSKQNDNQCVTALNCTKIKEESAKEKKSSPTPLSKVKKERKKKRVVVGVFSPARERPRDFLEVQKNIDEYCNEDKMVNHDVLTGRDFLDTMNRSGWIRNNGTQITDWQEEVRSFIIYRTEKKRKEDKETTDKLAVIDHLHEKKLKEQSARTKNKSEPTTPHVGHVEVNKPVFQDYDDKGGIKRYNELLAQGYSPEQIARMIE